MKIIVRNLVGYGIYFGMVLWLRFFMRGPANVVSEQTTWLLVGGLLGMGLSVIDRLLYVYYSAPMEQLSVQVKGLIARGKLLDALRLITDRRAEQVKLAMNNILFMVGWVVVAVLVVTTSRYELAKGLMLGVGLKLVLDIYLDWQQKEHMLARLFWPVARRINWKEGRWVVYVFGGIFGVVSLLSV